MLTLEPLYHGAGGGMMSDGVWVAIMVVLVALSASVGVLFSQIRQARLAFQKQINTLAGDMSRHLDATQGALQARYDDAKKDLRAAIVNLEQFSTKAANDEGAKLWATLRALHGYEVGELKEIGQRKLKDWPPPDGPRRDARGRFTKQPTNKKEK